MEDKTYCLCDILRHDIKDEDMVDIWNTYCEDKGLVNSVIHKNQPSVINELFPDAASFARLFAYKSNYDYTCDWLVFGEEGIASFSDISCYASPLEYDEVAEWLIGGGKCAGKDLLQQGMKEWFVFNYFEDEDRPLTQTEAYAVCCGMDVDYITADWDELAEEVKKRLNQ